ncbi:MAG: sulfotransferase domain-containing protein [Anaerolineales bacterium]
MASNRGLPIVFANAMAKSGSHILEQFLEGLELMTPLTFTDIHPIRTMDATGQFRSTAAVLRDLGRLRPGDMGWGYIPSRPAYIRWFEQSNVVSFFVFRDPRDKIVSHILYAMDIHLEHAMHDFYHDLDTMEKRIEATIDGVPGYVEDVGRTYESYLGWLELPSVFPVRFEDLVVDQPGIVRRMIQHLESAGVEIRGDFDQNLRDLLEAMAPQHSPTFRSGTAGGWRDHFTDENIRHFKESTGELLIELGYEESGDWD